MWRRSWGCDGSADGGGFRRTAARVARKLPLGSDELWTMDFRQDAFATGRRFRTLNLMDGFTRCALRIEVDTSLPGLRVVRVLEELKGQGRKPKAIVIDHGTEFTRARW